MSGVWFRKGLRLHDNPALCAACEAGAVVPFYVLDPADTKQVPRVVELGSLSLSVWRDRKISILI